MRALATEPTTLTDASPLYYVENGTGPPVVLLHGMGADSRTWDGIRPYLAEAGFRILTPDLPGHGRSPKPWRSYRLPFYLAYLTRWLRRLQTGPVHLVGHSLGGALAAAMAIHEPDMVASVGGICPIRLIDHRPPVQVLSVLARYGFSQLLGRPSEGATRRMLERAFGLPSEAVTPDLISLWQETAMASRRAVISTNQQLQKPEFALQSRLGEIRCPVWLLWGKRDPFFPGVDTVTGITATLPAAAQDFSDSGHLPMFERPDQLARRVESHLKKVTAARLG